jgi:hypothetical protein
MTNGWPAFLSFFFLLFFLDTSFKPFFLLFPFLFFIF